MIIASIDLMDGQVVQLRQGKEHVLTDERDPVALAQLFNRYGEVAVVDLDAATGKNPNGPNVALIRKMCQVADVRVGGGIRDVERARLYLRAGAKWIMVGTAATPEFLAQLPAHRVMVAVDHDNGQVVDQGWAHATGESVADRAQRLAPYCGGYLCTFVATEGTLSGMDLEAIQSLKETLPHPVTVAGGVATTDDAVAVSQLGVDVQVGMALYTGKLSLGEGLVATLDFEKQQGLLPTIVQDADTREILMLAYSSQESLAQALEAGQGIYFSRSRNDIWHKGATSGHTQHLIACRTDCDRDSLIFQVRQTGPACHTNAHSCFGQGFKQPGFSIAHLFNTLKQRKAHPTEGSYTAKLLHDRPFLLKKLMEEAFEVAQAPDTDNLTWEIGDLIYFASVLAVAEGVEWHHIVAELGGRER